MNPETVGSAIHEVTKVDSECPSPPAQPPTRRGVWTRDIEALCRALDAQQRAQFRSAAEEKK